MQRTPNLGLPQFEPSDKYRLEDYNEAYMKIDEKIKELKDKEAVIDTWETFKNTGGEIGGNLIASTVKSWGDTMVDGNLWIGNFSREQNGYTKLPNGLIMQWGRTVIEFNNQNSNLKTVTYPITFPKGTLSASPVVFGKRSFNVAVSELYKEKVVLWGFETTKGNSSTPLDVLWIAIGY